MRQIFAAPRRASKNHLVLRRFCIFLQQVFDGYQVLFSLEKGTRDRLVLVVRQSTALQQRGLFTAFASLLQRTAMSITIAIDCPRPEPTINPPKATSANSTASQRFILPLPCKQPIACAFCVRLYSEAGLDSGTARGIRGAFDTRAV
jgi:hypothetical protein